MSRRMNAIVVALILFAALSVPRPARAQGVGSCFAFGEWVISQGGQVYFVEPSLTPPFAIIGVELYGQGFSVLCIP